MGKHMIKMRTSRALKRIYFLALSSRLYGSAECRAVGANGDIQQLSIPHIDVIADFMFKSPL